MTSTNQEYENSTGLQSELSMSVTVPSKSPVVKTEAKNTSSTCPEESSASSMPTAPFTTSNAIDVLLMAHNIQEESQGKTSPDNTNLDHKQQQHPNVAYVPSVTKTPLQPDSSKKSASHDNTEGTNVNSTKSSPSEENNVAYALELSQASQVSSTDAMLSKYENAGLTSEVIGEHSTLSQELALTDSEKDAAAALQGSHNPFSQPDSQQVPFSLSQNEALPALPTETDNSNTLETHVEAKPPASNQENSQTYTQSQRNYTGQPESQAFSLNSFPDLPISQTESYPQQDSTKKAPDLCNLPLIAAMKEPILTEHDRQTLNMKASVTSTVIKKTRQKKRSIEESKISEVFEAANQVIEQPEKRYATSSNGAQRPVTYKPRKSYEEKAKELSEANYHAKRAVDLINRLASNKKVEKQILLSMALTRTSPRSGPPKLPPPGTKLSAGFQWSQFPPLEKLLRGYMEEYYELSIEVCQSILQQEFNNKLVLKVQEMATFHGWEFDFTFKALRDRVRCYFKTHIQNAKKRLKTMTKNPTKKANAKALAAHLDLLEMHEQTSLDVENKEAAEAMQKGDIDEYYDYSNSANAEDAAKVLGQFRSI